MNTARRIFIYTALVVAFLLAMSVFTPTWAQQNQPMGATTNNVYAKGMLSADSALRAAKQFKVYPYFDSTGEVAVVGHKFYYHNGLIWVKLQDSTGSGISGTQFTIPVFTGTTSIGNSNIIDSTGVGHSYVNDTIAFLGKIYAKNTPIAVSPLDSILVKGSIKGTVRVVPPPVATPPIVWAWPADSVSLSPTGAPGIYGDAAHTLRIGTDTWGRVYTVTAVSISDSLDGRYFKKIDSNTHKNAITFDYFTAHSATFTASATTAGSVLFSDGVGIAENNTHLFWSNTNKRFGVNNNSPMSSLEVTDTSTNATRGIINSQYNTGANSAQFNLFKARGTLASPTTIVTGDLLGRVIAGGYDGTAFLSMADIKFLSTGTIGANRIPTIMTFSTGTDASPSVLTERMRISTAGQISFGTTDINSFINIGGGGIGWSTGQGARIHILGPTDQPLSISASIQPTAGIGATTIGNDLLLTASNASPSSSIAGAAAGGAITMASGNAARFTSGNANGGAFNFNSGTGTGTGTAGALNFNPGGTNVVSILSSGTVAWNSGDGAVSHLLGPTDQPLKLASSPTSAGNGNNISIIAASGVTPASNNTGGDVNITAGNSVGNTSSRAGAVNITGGASGNNAVSGGGNVVITAGGASGGGTASPSVVIQTSTSVINGGAISILTPSLTNNGATGAINVTTGSTANPGGGNSGGNSGAFVLTVGSAAGSINATTATGGGGGTISILGGAGGNTSSAAIGTAIAGNGSSVSFISGAGGSCLASSGTRTGGNSGSFIFRTGALGSGGGGTNGTAGTISFDINGANTKLLINAAGDVVVNGSNALLVNTATNNGVDKFIVNGSINSVTPNTGVVTDGTVVFNVSSGQYRYLLRSPTFTGTGNTTFSVPANSVLDGFAITCASSQALSAGTTLGGTDIMNAVSFSTTFDYQVINKWFSTSSSQTIFITGGATSCTITAKMK